MKCIVNSWKLAVVALLLTLFSTVTTFSASAAEKNAVKNKNPIPAKGGEVCQYDKRPHALHVKFRDGLKIRLRKGQLVDLNGKALLSQVARDVMVKLEGSNWVRTHLVDEATLDRIQATAEKQSGQRAPDLNLYFTLGLSEKLCISDAINLLSLLDEVDYVYPFPRYELTMLEDYSQPRGFFENAEVAWQKYLSTEADGGIETRYAHSIPGGDGTGVNIMDVEYAFEPGHFELHGTVHDFEDGTFFLNTEQRYIDHGTAALGVAAADRDRPGIVGIAPKAEKYFAPVLAGDAQFTLQTLIASYCQQIPHNVNCTNVEGALVYELAAGALRRGDVVLLELQVAGPNSPPDFGYQNQLGGVPMEWIPAVFDAIRTLTYSGVVVVEGGGNGDQNLDDPVYQAGAHQPFLVENGVKINDSGAIIVGATSSGTDWSGYTFLPGATSPRAPVGIPHKYSSFGQRVDVHAWGDGVVTSGYGDLYGNAEPVLTYTAQFAGTSSASAIVAGSVASLQGVYKNLAETHGSYSFRTALWSPTMRNVLRRTGTAKTLFDNLDADVQQGLSLSNRFNLDPDANVGTQPNLRRAIDLLSVRDEDYCDGRPVPPPTLSAESGPVTLRNGGFRIGFDYGGDAPFGPGAGVFDIIYTTDGSEPDCVPRLGSCDINRVHAITQPMVWRLDHTQHFQATDLPVTIRARTAVVWPSCGIRFSEETTANYVTN